MYNRQEASLKICAVLLNLPQGIIRLHRKQYLPFRSGTKSTQQSKAFAVWDRYINASPWGHLLHSTYKKIVTLLPWAWFDISYADTELQDMPQQQQSKVPSHRPLQPRHPLSSSPNLLNVAIKATISASHSPTTSFILRKVCAHTNNTPAASFAYTRRVYIGCISNSVSATGYSSEIPGDLSDLSDTMPTSTQLGSVYVKSVQREESWDGL